MAALLALRFLAELGMLTCLGVGGWQLGDSLLTSIGLGVGLPLVAASIWGRWVAPRASRRMRDPGRLAVEVTLFALALLVAIPAEPRRLMLYFAVAVWVAFLVSIPSRGHEPALSAGSA